MSTREHIPIAVAEVVKSSKDANVNQEIDQRIASVITEIEGKAAQLKAVNDEINALKKGLEPLFGATFIRRQIISFQQNNIFRSFREQKVQFFLLYLSFFLKKRRAD